MKPKPAPPLDSNWPPRFAPYPRHTAEALHALAERRLPWPEYLRERERILELVGR
jgi:hypothetical protein